LKVNWTPELEAQLVHLRRTEALPYTEIGRRLRISKNAVVGKARRLQLPTVNPPRPHRPQRPRQPAPTPTPVVPTPAPVPPVLPHFAPIITMSLHSQPCRFPMWSHHERASHNPCFCNEPSRPGRPYCEDHHAICFVKHRQPSEAG
jgi:GcrA cell cycle regulator